MKILRIDHLGIAVAALGPAVSAYEALGFRVDARHDVPTEKVRTAFLPVGESHLELLEPTDPGSVIARFLEKRSGLHHVCVVVDDIVAALAELKARGVPLVDEEPRVGAGGFGHPPRLVEILARRNVDLDKDHLLDRDSPGPFGEILRSMWSVEMRNRPHPRVAQLDRVIDMDMRIDDRKVRHPPTSLPLAGKA